MRVVNINKEKLKDKTLYYQCGSRKLCHWLITYKQIFPINSYVHTNGKLISVFVMNEELSECLKEWSIHKPVKEIQPREEE